MAFFDLFIYDSWENGWQIALIIFYTALIIGLYIILSFNYYYEVEKKCVIVHKPGKNLTYYYENILYINEELSEKKKTLIFVMTDGTINRMVYDKNNEIRAAVTKKCKNLMSKEEFMKTYPGFKF